MRGKDAEVRRMAQWIARRWARPAWFSVEDIEQEIRAAFFAEVQRGREESIAMLAALDRAKRAVHHVRGVGAHRPNDKAPTHDVLTLDGNVDVQACDDVALDDVVDAGRRIRALVWTTDSRRLMFEAVAKCRSVRGAVELLYRDPGTRLACRFNNPKAAHRAVMRVVKDAARQILMMRIDQERQAA